MDISARTVKALGVDLIESLKSMKFCIVGCGGTGAHFAELLVRSGATELDLIDGSKVKESDLNRIFCFSASDIGQPKVNVLKSYLETIGPGLTIRSLRDSFRTPEAILKSNPLGQQARDYVYDADVVFIATDTNKSRIAIERLCDEKIGGSYLSCGIWIDIDKDDLIFECAMYPNTPVEAEEMEGYGPENASYAAIVHEASSVAFSMLLNHLRRETRDFKFYRKRYDSNFLPIEVIVNRIPSGSTPLC